MTVTETTGAPIRRPAEIASTDQRLGLGMRVAVWTGLASLGALFWLGVWKAVELAF